ncbi:MICOS complex subunit MIC19-like [Prorops nasuta]|uniref:MICOS complex subunit MIC19-like n=1 Tax=Prorops nasuta TaxID=863751 RepID=UPI0034CE014F
MGSGQSARKLTISNENGVIDVSNDLVRRLANSSKAKTSQSTEEVKSVPSEHYSSKCFPPKTTESTGYPVFYYPELTLTALEIKQQKEKELNSQQKYWQLRMKKMEENYMKINNIIEEEYVRALKEMAPSVKGQARSIQPCLDNGDKVLKCYQENPKEALKCAKIVEEFSNCVDQQRLRLISAH